MENKQRDRRGDFRTIFPSLSLLTLFIRPYYQLTCLFALHTCTRSECTLCISISLIIDNSHTHTPHPFRTPKIAYNSPGWMDRSILLICPSCQSSLRASFPISCIFSQQRMRRRGQEFVRSFFRPHFRITKRRDTT